MLLTEIADRVWLTPAGRVATGGSNLGVVAGTDGFLLVGSTRATSATENQDAGGLVEAVEALGRGPVLTVVLTHVDTEMEAAGDPTGDRAPELSAVSAVWRGADLLLHEDAAGPVAESTLAAPVRTFSAAAVVDLGARVVEVVHPGAGHSAGAAVVRVPDTDVVWVGELVAGPGELGGDGAVPQFGAACHPLAWPSTLDVVLDLLTPASVVVPSRGHLVSRGYVEDQRNEVGLVSQTVRDLAAAGVSAAEALERGDWPYSRDLLDHAVRRGYAALPRGARQLPRA